MIDIQGEITAILNELSGITAWRNSLPAGFKNDTPTVVVKIDGDIFHQTGATRLLVMQCRIYGGSQHLADCRNVYESVVAALSNYNSATIASIGSFRGQELPPEISTGWPGYIVRFEARVKETNN